MKELKELTKEFTKIFGDLEELTLEKITDDNCHKFRELIESDLETDYLQAIYQFYMADREGNKQDFTPKSLAKLVSRLTQAQNEEWVYDMCSGSGALTIQKWCSNKNLKFVCEELDERVIPYLLFNLKLRNIEGYVVNGNILTGEHKSVFKLTKGQEFSQIEPQMFFEYPKFTTGISNPPFNLTGDETEPVKLKNMNYVFIFKMLERVNGKVAFILPNGVLTSSDEKVARQYLEDNKLIRAVIGNPDKMFVSTSIPTTTLLFEKNSDDITFVNCIDNNFEQEERKQKGELHTKNREYTKTLNVFSDENISKIIECVDNRLPIPNLTNTLKKDKLEDNLWNPKRYIEIVAEKKRTRPYEDIITDLDRVIKQRNANKLTINDTWANQVGLQPLVEMAKQSSELTEKINKIIKNVLKIDVELDKQSWLTTTKCKELKIENKDKEEITTIFLSAIEQWKALTTFLNNEENRLLIELREKLLPDLMEGKIEVDDVEI